jgi:hypothetical protein
MTGQCCNAGRGPHSPARRVSGVCASLLPGALLAVMPKCPLCLAAWLMVATGIGIPAAGAAWIRGALAALWFAAVIMTIRRLPAVRNFLTSRLGRSTIQTIWQPE